MSYRLLLTVLVLTPLATAWPEVRGPQPLLAAQGPQPGALSAGLVPDPPMTCGASCIEWNVPRAPFKVFGNTYYVGTQGLSSVLITTAEGLVLIDVALPQSAPLIDANITTLGLRTRDVKYILTSHAHFDHVGGVRSMQRYTGATVLTSASSARALGLGHPVPEDPQYGTGPFDVFPAVTEGVRVMKDGETVRLGATAITAHYTPGHTPGATTWTWQSCEGARCLNMAYVDSLTAVSNDTFRFTGNGTTPGIVDTFRASIRKVGALACDVVLTTHPSASGMDKKLEGRPAPGAAADAFVNAGACKALAAQSLEALDKRVAREAQK